MMFSDIHSVRSLPTSPNKRRPRHVNNPFDIVSPSELSRAYSPRHHQYNSWRNSLHPEVDQKYNLLLRGEPVPWKLGEEKMISPIQGFDSTNRSEKSSGGLINQDYEDKIKGLEEQNHNLREELYYLREALLINFQTKETRDSRILQ